MNERETSAPDPALPETELAELARACRLSDEAWAEKRGALMKTTASAPAKATIPKAVRSSCVYCRGSLERAEAIYCATCLAPHHADCFVGHGRCSILGCETRHGVRPHDLGDLAKRSRPGRSRRSVTFALLAGAAIGALGMASWSDLYPRQFSRVVEVIKHGPNISKPGLEAAWAKEAFLREQRAKYGREEAARREAGDAFRAAVAAFESGEHQEAERRLLEVLAADPSPEMALDYRELAGYQWWVKVIARGGESAGLAGRLLKLAEQAAKEQQLEALRAEIDTMLTCERKFDELLAVERLAEKSAEDILPLLESRYDTASPERLARLNFLVQRLGSGAPSAVVASLLISPRPRVQENACHLLRILGDRRAAPALEKLAQTTSIPRVREAASLALVELAR